MTDKQRKTIAWTPEQDGAPIRVRDNGQEYVLLRPDVYERLSEGEYDDGPWTAAEMDALREESTAMLDRCGKDA